MNRGARLDFKARNQKGAEKSLEQADEEGWAVVNIKNDWTTVFADAGT